MSASIEEVIKDAKIAELLEVVLEIESEIKSIPQKINSELIFLERTISALPGQLSENLKNIAIAVDDVEKTAAKIKEETQLALTALSQTELSKTQQETSRKIQSSIDEAVKKSLSGAKAEIQALEERVRSVTASARKHNPAIMNYVLAMVMMVMIVTMLFSTIYLWGEVRQARNLARHAERALNIGGNVMDKLPEKYKKQIRDTIEKQ